MKVIAYEGTPLKPVPESLTSKPGIPFLYILVEVGTKAPFYIGEYGKAKTYDVLERIRRHFGKGTTLARVNNNLSAFGFPIPSAFTAYLRELPEVYSDPDRRKSLEAWVIQLTCHEKKLQSPKFCVVKYQAPSSDESAMARQIIEEFKRHA